MNKIKDKNTTRTLTDKRPFSRYSEIKPSQQNIL